MTNINDLVSNFDPQLKLDLVEVDTIHQEFLHLVEQATKAKGLEFADIFKNLLAHTQAHFSGEEENMKKIGHSSMLEHISDHQRILGDMSRFNDKVQVGRTQMARAWMTDSLLQWFDTHVKTMDSALAVDLKKHLHKDSITESA
ncbi:bacteriohemerythrin [Sessilibacter sp. MAH1]